MDRVSDSSLGQKSRRRCRVVDYIGECGERLGARFVRLLNISKVGYKVFENLPPSYQPLEWSVNKTT